MPEFPKVPLSDMPTVPKSGEIPFGYVVMVTRVQTIQDGLALTEPAKPQATTGTGTSEQASQPAPSSPNLKSVPSPAEIPGASRPVLIVPSATDVPGPGVVPAPAVTPPPPNPNAKIAPVSVVPTAPAPATPEAIAAQTGAATPATPPNPVDVPVPSANQSQAQPAEAQKPAVTAEAAPVAAPATPAPAPAAPPKPKETPAAAAPKMRPVAGPAKLKRRHYGLMASFVALVILPAIISTFYLFVLANDQYASRAGFTIRQEDGSSASSILGGLSLLTGSSQGVNAGVLHEFMQSQAMLEKIDARIDLRAHYSQGWPKDPVYSIWPDATTEELFSFWKRVLRLSYDSSTGLIDLTVQALDPDTAQRIAQVILEESQIMINRLNDAARRDSMSNAERDLEEAVASLRTARGALTVFRAQTRIVDPVADIQGRLGVVSNLQQQLAQALVELDLLDPSTRSDDPRREQISRKIGVIRNRIEEERNFFGNTENQASDDTYPEMIAKYEGLSVDLEFAERNYVAALAAKQAALSNASRQTLYLAAYIPPTKAQDSEYPERFTLLALVIGFLMMTWAILALVYYSLRDRG